MPDKTSHLNQANKNLELIEHLVKFNDYWDWKVTISFYTCLHIVNAHLAVVSNLHYQRHGETQNAIDPAFNRETQVDQDTYIAYRKLRNLSNRARYLAQGQQGKGSPDTAYYIHDVHYTKTLRHLNTVIKYFSEKYNDFNLHKIKVKCADITNKTELKYIEII